VSHSSTLCTKPSDVSIPMVAASEGTFVKEICCPCLKNLYDRSTFQLKKIRLYKAIRALLAKLLFTAFGTFSTMCVWHCILSMANERVIFGGVLPGKARPLLRHTLLRHREPAGLRHSPPFPPFPLPLLLLRRKPWGLRPPRTHRPMYHRWHCWKQHCFWQKSLIRAES
jgi:hypothetical protein